MFEDTNLYCNLYWEGKPEKKNKSGTSYSKSWDGILIKDKPTKLQKLVKRSCRLIAKTTTFRRSAPTQNATKNKSISFSKWEDQNEQRHSVLTSSMAKTHGNKTKTCLFFLTIWKKTPHSQLHGLHSQGNCFSFLVLGLTSLLFSPHNIWFLKFHFKRFPLHEISQFSITAKNSSYFLKACALQ